MNPIQIKAALAEAVLTLEHHLSTCAECDQVTGALCPAGRDLAGKAEAARGTGAAQRTHVSQPPPAAKTA